MFGSCLFANGLFKYIPTADGGQRLVLHAMPLLIVVLCVLAIAYRYYSAFLAAKVAVLDDSRLTPAHRLNDGQNYHPTNKWVLFGHHFAAISGAGPLIGPVLAIQYGYFPGLLWLVIGVCLAGAVQDMLVMAASVRRDGKSLAEIAKAELGPWASVVVSLAILFIVVIALAGLGYVVVKALGGEEIKLGPGMEVKLPQNGELKEVNGVYTFPEGCQVCYAIDDTKKPEEQTFYPRPESFKIQAPRDEKTQQIIPLSPEKGICKLPPKCLQMVNGSSWGTFTIFCTIPIALFVGLWMYKIRKGRVIEASLIGAAGVLAATVIGASIPGSVLEPFFSLSKEQTVWALCLYGFIASVLPVWLLLCPRDYLSSFLKIGTIVLLVVGVLIANPSMKAPLFNETFQNGGPTFPWGGIFPFVFICIMCGAVSGFHALVSSGTTPKMVEREKQIRPIGYGAMLIEGLVGVVALIAAASLEPRLYFDINVDLSSPKYAQYQKDIDKMAQDLGDGSLHNLPVEEKKKRDLASVEEMVGNESLRGRTGGAVTLAVGMSFILSDAMKVFGLAEDSFKDVMKYWYHFAIMFEALFILTTIDTGTRIARFLVQEAMGKVHKKFEKTDWLPGAIVATALVTFGWGYLVHTSSIDTIWPMFGIANQLLAVVALALVTTWLVNTGRARFAPVTLLPMVFVTITTNTAGVQMITQFIARITADPVKWILNISLTVFVMVCVATLLLMAVARWIAVIRGVIPTRREDIVSSPTPPDAGGSPPSAPMAGPGENR
jgi:carbon starvation protein